MTKKLTSNLADLRKAVVEMGKVTVTMVMNTVNAVESCQPHDLIQTVLEDETILDQLQLEIDKEVIRVLTVHSPVADDLRFVMSVSRITTDLERIGDQATNMCELLQLMDGRTDVEVSPELITMASVVSEMVSESLIAFANNEDGRARLIIVRDDLVDSLNDQITAEVLSPALIRDALARKRNVAGAFSHVLIARSLERMADQATNISEEVVYISKGIDIRHMT